MWLQKPGYWTTERTQQSSVLWLSPGPVLSICRGPGFGEFSCIQRMTVQPSESKDTSYMCILTKIKDMQLSQTKANRRDSATVRVRVKSTCRCVQRPHTLSTILQRAPTGCAEMAVWAPVVEYASITKGSQRGAGIQKQFLRRTAQD